MTRFLWWLVGLPVGIVIVALAVANRRPIALSLNPFLPEDPQLTVAVPGFLLVLGAVILGVLLGGIAVWISQGYHRREARRWREAAQRLDQDGSRDTGLIRLAAPGVRRAA